MALAAAAGMIGNRAAAGALRVLLMAGLVVALGPPINDNLRFLVLLAAGFLVLVLPLRAAVWRYPAAAILVVAAAWLPPTVFPRAAIEEGHNVFLYPNEPTVLERELPPPVFEVMRDQFLRQYPRRDCARPKWCWLEHKMPDRLFAFSAEGLGRAPKFSRVVDDIGFDGLDDFRGGFVNDLGYNWDGAGGTPDRDRMPFFVMYELPERVVGGRLCWRGHVLWEGEADNFRHLVHRDRACRDIAAQDAGRRMFGVSILADAPLAVDLELPTRYRIAGLAALAVRLAAVLGVLLLCLGRPSRGSDLRADAGLLVLALAIMVLYVLTRDHDFVFGGNPPIKVGTDGLHYAEYAKSILIGLANGDVVEMLRGGQDVFLMMPGLAYLRAFERLVFGDTNYLYAAALLATPFAVRALAATMVSPRWAWWFAASFILLPVMGELGLWFYNYLHLGMDGGIAEPAALTLFFAALALTLRRLPGPFAGPGFLANLMLALAVLCRPNFAVGAAVIIAVVTWRLWRQGRLGEAVVAAAGFLPVLFMTWHNYYFGGVFVPATSSAGTGATLHAPLSVYMAAAGDLLSLDFGGQGLQRVARQWGRWLRDWIYVPLLLWMIVALVAGRMSANARLVAYAALAQHAVLLFWNARSRFTYIAWGLTVFALLPYFEQATRAIARRWRDWRRPGRDAAGA